MGFLRADFTWGWKALVIAGIALLFGGFAVLMYGEFSPSIGLQGVIDYGIRALGFVAMGVGVACFVPVILRDPWRSRPRTEEGWRTLRGEAAREAGVIALNLVCYVGAGLVALGALTALGRAPVAAGITMLISLAVLVRYRWHRWKHRCTYDHLKPFGIVLIMLAFGLVAGIIGGMQAADAIADAAEGPSEEACMLNGFKEQRPSGRGAAFNATDLVIDFTTGVGNKHVYVSIKEQDRAVLQQIVDAGGFVRLTYYPRTNVFVRAESSLGWRTTDNTSGAN